MEKAQEFTPSQLRIAKLKKLKEDKEQGIFNGIPLWEGFPKLSETIPSIDKGQVILNAAASGVGSCKLYVA